MTKTPDSGGWGKMRPIGSTVVRRVHAKPSLKMQWVDVRAVIGLVEVGKKTEAIERVRQSNLEPSLETSKEIVEALHDGYWEWKEDHVVLEADPGWVFYTSMELDLSA